jgi:hypothetical protein
MIDLYFIGVGLTAMWMFADDFDRHTILALDLNIEPKYKLKDYAWRPLVFPYFIAKFLFNRIKN